MEDVRTVRLRPTSATWWSRPFRSRSWATTDPSGANAVPGPYRRPKRRTIPPTSMVSRSALSSAATTGRNGFGPSSHSGRPSSCRGATGRVAGERQALGNQSGIARRRDKVRRPLGPEVIRHRHLPSETTWIEPSTASRLGRTSRTERCSSPRSRRTCRSTSPSRPGGWGRRSGHARAGQHREGDNHARAAGHHPYGHQLEGGRGR